MRVLGLLLAALLLATGVTVVGGMGIPAAAKVVRVEKADRPGGKVLTYVEPFKFNRKTGVPRRLFVEFHDGSAWVFTPCKKRARNCFVWTGDAEWPYLKFRGKTIYM